MQFLLNVLNQIFEVEFYILSTRAQALVRLGFERYL